ncbi:MAG: aldose 1-epimerase family protein, partial [Lentisphaeria bacterium]|nr:aldose 1-epimerase family protein [Lentisphaeria bacterium]
WLRTWPGGLLTTAGLLNVGGPEGGHGLHGRASHIAADDLKIDRAWVDGEYVLSVGGTIRHTMAFGEKLEIRRQIKTVHGKNVIMVRDTVENQGFAPVPLMMLYHCNFGYPLVDGNAYIKTVEHKVTGKDEASQADIANWSRLEAPTHGYAEEVFIHEIPADSDGLARMSIVNPAEKMQVTIAYDPATLPVLNHWKQMGEGEYVIGMEPGNCTPTGQSDNEKSGMLRMIEPGEVVDFKLQIEVIEL